MWISFQEDRNSGLGSPLVQPGAGAYLPRADVLTTVPAMTETVYKILGEADLRGNCGASGWAGSADDLRDGFVHLSAADQVTGTLEKHFAGRTDLLLAAFDTQELGPALKWEASRGGALFPHLYTSRPLPLQDGAYLLPELAP